MGDDTCDLDFVFRAKGILGGRKGLRYLGEGGGGGDDDDDGVGGGGGFVSYNEYLKGI